MRVVADGVVFSSRPKTDAASCCFPNVCVMPSGRWVVGFRLGPAKASRTQRAFISWSDDQGNNWSQPIQPLLSADFARRKGTWRAVAMTPLGNRKLLAVLCWEDYSEPLVPMFNPKTEGIIDMKLYVALSFDEGASFCEPIPVDCGRYGNAPTPITGAALVFSAERWAVQFEVNKHYHDPAPWQHASALTFTSDGGRTWSGTSDVHTDPARRIICWDQRLALLPDGSILGLFWTFDRQKNDYLNIHARQSRDGGRTWGDLWDTGVPGQPARPAALPDGRIVMIYVDRTSIPVIKARCSSDNGRTWPANTELVVHRRFEQSQTWAKKSMQDAWAEMAAFSIGLPDATPLPGGDVLVVYYSGDHPDYTDVRWARISSK